MRTISVVSQKGGAGKTTIAVHLAVAAQAAGLSVAIVDMDPQASAARWSDDRTAEEPEVVSIQPARLTKTLDTARAAGADLVVIDTAPDADGAALTAIRASDLVLIPCRPSAFDLAAIATTRELVRIEKKTAYIVLSAAPVRSALVAEASAGLTAEGAQIAPVVLHNRIAFSHAVIDGRTATEYDPGGKAAEEARALMLWACRHVGLSPDRQADTTTLAAE